MYYSGTLISPSATLNYTPQKNFFKFVFYTKVADTFPSDGTPEIITAGTATTVTTSNSLVGSASANYYYAIVPFYQGKSFGTVTPNTAIITASAISIGSIPTISWTPVTGALGYTIYRGTSPNNLSKMARLASVAGTVSTYSDPSFASSLNTVTTQYSDPTTYFTGNLKVIPTVTLFDSATPTASVSNLILVKTFDENNNQDTFSEGVVDVSIDAWKKVEVWCGVPYDNSNVDAFTHGKLNLQVVSEYQSAKLLVANIQVYKISEGDFFKHHYFPTESAFLPNRPGEALLHPLLPTSDKLVANIYNSSSATSAIKPVSFAIKNPDFATTYGSLPLPYFQMLPSLYDRYNHYVGPGITTDSQAIQAFYESYLAINKIVLKYNTAFSTPSDGTLAIYSASADGETNYTKKNIKLRSSDFNKSGLTVLYYQEQQFAVASAVSSSGIVTYISPNSTLQLGDRVSVANTGVYDITNAVVIDSTASAFTVVSTASGAFTASGIATAFTWSTQPWNSPPQLSSSGSFQNTYNNVTGIEFKTIVSNIATTYPPPFTYSSYPVQIVELSPRLEIDLTNLVQRIDVRKEMSSPNDNGFPFSYITANSGTVELSNIPIYKGASNKASTIFENESKNATFANLLRQGVKFTGFLTYPTLQDWTPSPLTEAVPLFTMYSNSWNLNDIDSVSVDLFDITKIALQGAESPLFYATNSTLFNIITSFLSAAGFSDFDYNGLQNTVRTGAKSTHFWTDETKTVFDNLQEFFLPHQIGAHIDEYGVMRFKSLGQAFNQFNSASFIPNLAITDRPVKIGTSVSGASVNYIANIIPDSFNQTIENKIGKIIAKYTTPLINDSPDGDPTNSVDAWTVQSSRAEVAKAIWTLKEPTALPQFSISKTLRASDTTMWIDVSSTAANKGQGSWVNPIRNIGQLSGEILLGSEILSYDGVSYVFRDSSSPSFQMTRTIENSADYDEAINDFKTYVSPNSTSVTYFPTGELMNLVRGKYGTSVQNHIYGQYNLTPTQLSEEFNFYVNAATITASLLPGVNNTGLLIYDPTAPTVNSGVIQSKISKKIDRGYNFYSATFTVG